MLSGWGSPLSCCCADINTIYSMGTAPFMLPISLLLVPPLHYREVKCCPDFRRWCRRYAADFTAVGAAFTLPRVDSSGEDVPSSRNVRPSTRSRRGRQGSGQSPCFASPARTRRADAEKESSESGSPESEPLDGGSHHSRGLSVPNEEHPKLPSPREGLAGSGSRLRRLEKSTNGRCSPVP